MQHTPNSPRHLKYLDSARGIAAMMVFLSHYIARNYQDKMDVHYLFFIFNGNDAVSFFFVLSGFVLSYKYIVLNKPLDVKQFYVNRIFRLFPAYFLTIVISALLQHRLDLNPRFLADIFIRDKTNFWEEALLFRFHNNYYYPGWTLTVEMLGSFLIPFYIALAIKNKKFVPYLIVVTLIIGNNLYYSYMFLFGFICSCNYAVITGESFKKTRWYKYRYPIIVAAILLFSIRQIDAISPFGPDYKTLASYLGIDFFTYTGLSCFVFLVAILHSKRLQHFLEHRLLVFIGKISYSIYLVHVFVISWLYIYLDPFLTAHSYNIKSFAVATVITLPAVILVATLMHYLVEMPFLRLGKRVIHSMRPSLIVRREAVNASAAPDSK